MSDLTPEALDRLAQLDADATPGPWFAWDRGVGWQVSLDPGGRRMLPEGMRTDLAREEDAALIAAMRTHLPALLDEVKQGRVRRTAERIVRNDLRNERDAARAEVAALRERVEALADSIHGDAGCEHNGGCEGEPGCLACIEADLRAALADPATDKEADA